MKPGPIVGMLLSSGASDDRYGTWKLPIANLALPFATFSTATESGLITSLRWMLRSRRSSQDSSPGPLKQGLPYAYGIYSIRRMKIH